MVQKLNCEQAHRHADITVISKADSVLIFGGKKAKSSIVLRQPLNG
jgi:hypothetical protein